MVHETAKEIGTIHLTDAVQGIEWEQTMKMSIGVDLHKIQFRVCVLSEDRRVNESDLYPTGEYGYDAFLRKMTGLNYAVRRAAKKSAGLSSHVP